MSKLVRTTTYLSVSPAEAHELGLPVSILLHHFHQLGRIPLRPGRFPRRFLVDGLRPEAGRQVRLGLEAVSAVTVPGRRSVRRQQLVRRDALRQRRTADLEERQEQQHQNGLVHCYPARDRHTKAIRLTFG
jgi:hypothetical protein